MSCKQCGMSPNNSVHHNRNQFGFHEFVSPPFPVYQPTLEERVIELERRVQELEDERKNR